MKILLIDQLSPLGHINYNKFWLKILDELKIEYEIIGNEKLLTKLNCKNKIVIPLKYYKGIENKNIIIRKLKTIILLSYIKKIVKLRKYDYIIFLTFENISLFLIKYFHKKNILLIGHDNFKRIENKVISWIFRRLGKTNTLIVLDDFIKKNLKKKNIESKLIIHPINKEINDYFKKNKDNYIRIFSPSLTSIDENLLKILVEDEKILKSLSQKNIKLILRSKNKNLKSKSSNIKILTNYLDYNNYLKFLCEADIIFLPYCKNFNNRISGVLYEAISINKTLIIPGYNDMRIYKEYIKEGIEEFLMVDDLYKIFENIEKLLKTRDYTYIREKYSLDEMKKNIIEIIKDR